MPSWTTVLTFSGILATAPTVGSAQALHEPDARPNPYRPTLGAFPRTIAANGARLFARGNLIPLLVGSSLTLAARAADQDVRRALGDNVSGIGDVVDAMGNGLLLVGGISALFAAGQIAGPGKGLVVFHEECVHRLLTRD